MPVVLANFSIHVSFFKDHYTAYESVPSLSTFEQDVQFSRNMVRTLCDWKPPRTFYIPTISNSNMADERTSYVGTTPVPFNKNPENMQIL
jgi:hypothetical protein